MLRALCRDVAVAEPVLRYAARLVRASDPASPDAPELVKRGVRFGAGVRGAQSLVLGGEGGRAAAKGARTCRSRTCSASPSPRSVTASSARSRARPTASPPTGGRGAARGGPDARPNVEQRSAARSARANKELAGC